MDGRVDFGIRRGLGRKDVWLVSLIRFEVAYMASALFTLACRYRHDVPAAVGMANPTRMRPSNIFQQW
jgi:hypothetical protein